MCHRELLPCHLTHSTNPCSDVVTLLLLGPRVAPCVAEVHRCRTGVGSVVDDVVLKLLLCCCNVAVVAAAGDVVDGNHVADKTAAVVVVVGVIVVVYVVESVKGKLEGKTCGGGWWW